MKNRFYIITIFLFSIFILAGNFTNVQAQTKDKKKVKKVEVEKELNTVCPVSKEDVDDDAVTVKYKNKSYQVCCKKCAVKFKKNPEKYIKRMEKNKKIKKEKK